MDGNPFTLMFGKEPKYMIERPEETSQVINDFTGENPSTQLYLITGPRGSGKTVLMSAISNILRKEKGWIVIPLNPYSDLQRSFFTQLYREAGFLSQSLKAKLSLAYENIGLEVETQSSISEINADLLDALRELKKRKKRILIKIDEVTNSPEIVKFISTYSLLVQENLPVYLLATGLPENIESLQNAKSLTFLYRARKIVLSALNLTGIARAYKEILHLLPNQAVDMAKTTKGYPYAFQVLGYFAYERNGNYIAGLSDVCKYLYDYVYEKVWNELSEKDKQVVIASVKSKSCSTKEIREILNMEPNEFSPYKARLIKKGIIDGTQRGKIIFSLPFFESFVTDKIVFFD